MGYIELNKNSEHVIQIDANFENPIAFNHLEEIIEELSQSQLALV